MGRHCATEIESVRREVPWRDVRCMKPKAMKEDDGEVVSGTADGDSDVNG